MSPVLRIGHGNGHNEDSLVRYVRDADADSFGCAEAQRLIDHLEGPGVRVTVAGADYAEAKHPSSSTRNRHRETCIVTRSSRTNLGELTVLASTRVPGAKKVGPDRVAVMSMYAHPVADEVGHVGVAHLEIHPDAGVASKDQAAPLVREYAAAMATTRELATFAARMGMLVVITGDLQVPGGFDKPFGPVHQLADPLNLTTAHVEHIDWLLIDRRLKATKVTTRRLFDHTGFVADLEPRT